MCSVQRLLVLSAFALAAACSSDPSSSPGNEAPPDLAVLSCRVSLDCAASPATPECNTSTSSCAPRGWHIGTREGTADSVELVEIYKTPGKEQPTGLSFNPEAPNELWVVSYKNDYITIIYDPGLPSTSTKRIRDPDAMHFMHWPVGIAFGTKTYGRNGKNTWGTCGDSDNPAGNSNGFMGPAVFSSDLAILGKQTRGGLGSHLDMLHNTPFCRGITYEKDNVYWVFDNEHGSLARYDFQDFHPPGGDDHSDGIIQQYALYELAGADGVPSHLVFEPGGGVVFAADTGNGRVVRLDPKSATEGESLPALEPTVPVEMVGATLTNLVSPGTMTAPSGVAIHETTLYVSDNATGRIHAVGFDGTPVRTLDTGLAAGALAGIAFGPDEKLYLVDMVGSRVLRIDPK